MAAKETKTLEQSMAELQAVIGQMEKEEIGLEESFRLYQEGMKLLKACNAAVDKVEKKLIVLEEKN
jgi:exodeoxyribonuclease VII small subunit